MGEGFLKKLTVVYIQKGLTLGYTTQAINLFNSHKCEWNPTLNNNDKGKWLI